MSSRELQQAAWRVLRTWNLHAHMPRFVSCADGWALLAHLCNAGAKLIDPDLYDDKPLLVQHAAEIASFAWRRDGIVYIETAYGQVSFHVFEDEDACLSYRPQTTGPWAGGWMQDGAYLMALAFLRGESCTQTTYQFESWLATVQP